MKMFYTDARVSGKFYRGELWYGTPDRRVLLYITERQYLSVEDATFAARRFIGTYQGQLIRANKCLVCHDPISEYEQVGRCVYANPCGHRQYQGKVPERLSA